MCPVTGAAALHVLLMRVGCAQDVYEVFGWTADTVFTRAEMHEKWTEFDEMDIVAVRLELMEDLSDNETDMEA